MAPPTRTPRSAWLEAALGALAAGGPGAVRVEALARSLGVTKGSFYAHFADRAALLDAALDTWERVSVDDVIRRVDDDGGDARDRLRRLFAVASSQPELLAIDLAVRDWARRDRAVAERLRRVDNERMEYLRAIFRDISSDEADVEARSLLVVGLWIGRHFTTADHGDRSRDQVIQAAAQRLLA